MAGGSRGRYNPKGGGSITEIERGKRYRLRVVVSPPGEEPVRQKTETFHGNVTAARQRLADLNREAATLRGIPPEEVADANARSQRTVSDLMNAYLNHLASPALARSPRSVQAATDADRLYIRPTLGSVRLQALSAEVIDRAISGWFDGVRLGKPLAPSSVRRTAAVLSSALSQAVKWNWISSNPARDAAIPTGKRTKKILSPSPADVTKLIKTAEETGDHPMATTIALAFITGCRRGELAALRWSDIDLEKGLARVSRSLVRDSGGWIEKGTKTNRIRTVPLTERAIALIRALPGDHDSDDRIIEVRNPDVLTDRFRKICIKANLVTEDDKPLFSLNTERHAHTTELIAAGIDIATVAALAGRNVRTTADIYTHALPGGADSARKALEDLT